MHDTGEERPDRFAFRLIFRESCRRHGRRHAARQTAIRKNQGRCRRGRERALALFQFFSDVRRYFRRRRASGEDIDGVALREKLPAFFPQYPVRERDALVAYLHYGGLDEDDVVVERGGLVLALHLDDGQEDALPVKLAVVGVGVIDALLCCRREHRQFSDFFPFSAFGFACVEGFAAFFSAFFAAGFSGADSGAALGEALLVTGLAAACFGFVSRAVMPSFFSASETAWWLAPFSISMMRSMGSRWRMLHFLLRVSPSTRTKFLSRISTTAHLFPASLPAIFTHTLPMSIMVVSSSSWGRRRIPGRNDKSMNAKAMNGIRMMPVPSRRAHPVRRRCTACRRRGETASCRTACAS